MKSTRTATTALRSARAAQSLPSQTPRFSSSEAGPSTTPAPKSSPRRLPRPTLRKLVDLHHHTSTFLQDPSTIHQGFRTALNTLHTPVLATYKDVAQRARSLHARRSLGGLDMIRKVYPGGAGMILDKGEFGPHQVQVSRSAWTGEQSWAMGQTSLLSERETRVREALYGSWSRGPRSETGEVGLEGAEEYAEARKRGVGEDAEAWGKRNESVTQEVESSEQSDVRS